MNIKEKIWNEKYRPQTIEECILPNSVKKTFEDYLIAGNCTNLMLHSTSGGTGKTTILKALCNELDYELLFINASEQRSIDVLRNDVTQFVSTLSIDGRNKAVLFDEFCLEENEKVIVGTTLDWKSIALKDLVKGVIYPIVSVNIDNFKLENDTGEIVSERIEEVYEVKLEDERTIIVTEEHPFFVYDCGNINEVSILDGLNPNNFVLTYSFHIPEFTKIKSISKIGERKVRNLVVYKNHNFITENGIVTHNCNSQAITQNALRGFIEQYSKVKFFFSCNYIDKIIPQLLSRCTVIPFNWKSDDKTLKTNFFKRIKYILEAESVPFKKEVVVELINRYFPDFRRIVNELQTYSITGSIDEGLLNYTKELDLSDLFESIKKKNFTDVRQWVEVNDNMSYELFYKNFYRDLKIVAVDNCLPNMILLIGQYQFRHNSVMDKQINTLAFLIEVMAEIKFK